MMDYALYARMLLHVDEDAGRHVWWLPAVVVYGKVLKSSLHFTTWKGDEGKGKLARSGYEATHALILSAHPIQGRFMRFLDLRS